MILRQTAIIKELPVPRVFIDPALKAQIDNQKALNDLDVWFADQLAAGYVVPGYNFRLGLQQEDVTLLTGAFVLAKEAAALTGTIPPIVDMDGVPQNLTLEEFTLVMLGYGQYRANLSAEYATRKAAIGV